MRILLVEDDQTLAEHLQKALINQHYSVEIAENGQVGLDFAAAFEYDLILLDLMLPQVNGIQFCQQIRSAGNQYNQSLNSKTPILLMTAKDSLSQRIEGLDAGADDYVVKPFHLNELLARVRALLRRGNSQRAPILKWGQLELDPGICAVTFSGMPVHLTAKEYKLLDLLIRQPTRIFSYGTIMDHLWALEDIPTENAIRAQVKGLRKKLKEVATIDLIETIYGLGYRLKNIVETPNSNIESSTQQFSQATIDPSPSPSKSWGKSLEIASFWRQSQQQYRDRLSTIEQAITALQQGTLTTELQQKAEREAHTLVGSLGLFGLDEASKQAREIERLLETSSSLTKAKKERLSQLALFLHQAISQPLPESEGTCVSQTVSSSVEIVQPLQQLLIVDNDAELATQLKQEAIVHRIQTTITPTLSQAREYLTQKQPDIILLDLTISDSTATGFELLVELRQRYPVIPILVFTAQGSLTDRVKASQLGASVFLQKPLEAKEIIKAVSKSLGSATTIVPKLLIVDDDLQMLEALKQILEPWGFQLTLLSDPCQFWNILEQIHPDLLLLDVEMPEFSGIDLCQAVRSDLKWGDLPILSLSAHTEETLIQQIFLAGADDYVSKPIHVVELVARVLNHLKRRKR